jgi:hypothetical protein
LIPDISTSPRIQEGDGKRGGAGAVWKLSGQEILEDLWKEASPFLRREAVKKYPERLVYAISEDELRSIVSNGCADSKYEHTRGYVASAIEQDYLELDQTVLLERDLKGSKRLL